MKLQQGQVWKRETDYLRIVQWEHLAIEYKSMKDLSKEGTLFSPPSGNPPGPAVKNRLPVTNLAFLRKEPIFPSPNAQFSRRQRTPRLR